jgi:hypothetical protein
VIHFAELMKQVREHHPLAHIGTPTVANPADAGSAHFT